jgi:indolepyruvate ferredoxin oxidoreductase
VLARRKPGSNVPAKITFGGWVIHAFKALAPLKVLRGTPLDIFGYTAERKREKALRDDYFKFIDELVGSLSQDNKALMLKVAQLPEQVRGYGHIKLRNMEKLANETQLLRQRMQDGTGREAVIRMPASSGSKERTGTAAGNL